MLIARTPAPPRSSRVPVAFEAERKTGGKWLPVTHTADIEKAVFNKIGPTY